MRRIYESEAIHRDDEEPHSPSELAVEQSKSTVTANQHRSLLDWSKASHALIPRRFRDRTIEVTVQTDRDVYASDEPVGIRIVFRNRVPFPVVIPTPTRRRWDWAVDGKPRAATEEFEPAPSERTLLSFYRSETKVFERTWRRRFRTARDRWEPAPPGAYEISAYISVDKPERRGLYASTTISLEN